jgi:hypothetical protein
VKDRVEIERRMRDKAVKECRGGGGDSVGAVSDRG